MKPWFKPVRKANGSRRFVAVSWEGYACIVATPLLAMMPQFLFMLPLGVRIILLVISLPLVLVALFRLVKARSSG